MTAKTVYVHIGPLKTGTTYLQSVLQSNVERLAANGVLFPRGSYAGQVASVLDVLDRKVDAGGRGNRGKWDKLVQEVHEWSGDRAIISQEFLCGASPKQVRRLVRTLAPADVHVIHTARELGRVIPAAWQTHIRNKRYPTWAEFVSSVRRPEDSRAEWGKKFWRQQDPARVLPPWEAHVPRERISIVTVPPPGADPELLWRRFSDVCGLDAGAYVTEVPRTNASLGVAEAEALRRVNEGLAGRMGGKQQTRWVKFFLARDVLEQRPNAIKLQLPPEDYPWVAERARAMVDFIAASGYRVVGDLRELVNDQPPTTPVVRPDEVDPAAVLDATVDSLVELLVEVRRRSPQRRAKAGQPKAGRATGVHGGQPAGRSARLGFATRRRGADRPKR